MKVVDETQHGSFGEIATRWKFTWRKFQYGYRFEMTCLVTQWLLLTYEGWIVATNGVLDLNMFLSLNTKPFNRR